MATARFVFQNGADLYVHDARDRETTARVEIEIPGATASLRPQMVDASDYMQGWSISPSGKRVAAAARGDLWTLPAKNGSPRNLSRTSGVAERSPSWSPDGKWIAYFSDEPGEYELFVRRSDGGDEPRRLTDDMGVFKNAIHWGPDSSFIVYADKTGDAHRVDLESGERTTFAHYDRGVFPKPSSHHRRTMGRLVGHGRRLRMGRIHLHDFDSGETHVVTSGMFNDNSPAFDRDGDWLYFTSDRRFAPSYSSLDGTWIYDDSGMLVAVPLRNDVDSPWLEESDEQEWKDEDAEGGGCRGRRRIGRRGGRGRRTRRVTPDPVTGTWECTADIPQMGAIPMTIMLVLNDDDLVTGTVSTAMFAGELVGTFDPESMALTLVMTIENGPTAWTSSW